MLVNHGEVFGLKDETQRLRLSPQQLGELLLMEVDGSPENLPGWDGGQVDGGMTLEPKRGCIKQVELDQLCVCLWG